ncbi:hypothetical protein BABINDRAFT_38611 [Babjeviella inositovora NRRL Y-12698]|uniref:Uncharacterized protein n=1 Tax=Babjeviella inositovora NRRL Y-12698 TaxID=984486 RepID=A0A1E3QMD4_9ASCO|nr:uncharacterized protein BABINDRAFT_38611 [Babjeviella inositovora NRRL Y-12698]ODQ78624.1 hypothetical protein BABINDRAFT_38611 [Babjeviella inositovora NRRL Y-12698]
MFCSKPRYNLPSLVTKCFTTTPALRRLISIRPLVEIKSCKGLEPSQLPEYIPSPHSQLHTLYWNKPIQNIFIVKKPWDSRVRGALIEFIKHIYIRYPTINVMVDHACADEIQSEFTATDANRVHPTPYKIYTSENILDITLRTDLMVSLGGDGTVLRGVSLFSNQIVPPVLPFSMGSLGFLLPFNIKLFDTAFQTVYESRAKVLHRARLECHVWRKPVLEPEASNEGGIPANTEVVHAMNDIVLHRGALPHLTTFDIYINNEFVTRTTGDGVTFSSPTGSTAYSLSCGGGIAHPLVECILLTPICPRSLSFRPLILPASAHIMLKVADTNRNSTIGLSIDGVSHKDLRIGDELHIVLERATPTTYACTEEVCPPSLMQRNLQHLQDLGTVKSGQHCGIWCVAKGENDWTAGINNLLGFNSSFRAL